MELEPGDKVVANRGISEVLAIGTVTDDGYTWRPDRQEYRHTVAVDWDTSFARHIEPVKAWATTTVSKVSGTAVHQRSLAPHRRRSCRSRPTSTSRSKKRSIDAGRSSSTGRRAPARPTPLAVPRSGSSKAGRERAGGRTCSPSDERDRALRERQLGSGSGHEPTGLVHGRKPVATGRGATVRRTAPSSYSSVD